MTIPQQIKLALENRALCGMALLEILHQNGETLAYAEMSEVLEMMPSVEYVDGLWRLK